MSTGDQTQYIRGKLAQRGVDQGVRFMRDGFDAWAESTAPARVGEMEKEPSDMTNMLGGRMTLQMAKSAMRGRRGGANPFYEESQMVEYAPQEEYKMAEIGIGGAMCGGDLVPQVVQDAINQAKKLIDMWRGVSKWLTDLKTELKYEVIDNADLPQDIRTVGQNFTNVLNAIAGYQATLDAVAQAASIVGMGRRGRMRGGDLASTIKMVSDAAGKIKSIIDWLVKYAPAVKYILSLDAFNTAGLGSDIGKEVIGFLQPVFSIFGAGRGGAEQAYFDGKDHYAITDGKIGDKMYMKAGPRAIGGRRGCEDECDCRPMRRGRAKPMTAQEMQDAVNKAMAEVKAKTISPQVASIVEKAKQLEARRASHVKSASSGKGRGGAELYYPPARGGRRVGGAVIGLEPVGGRRRKRGGAVGIFGEQIYEPVTYNVNPMKQFEDQQMAEEARMKKIMDEVSANEKARMQKLEDEFKANQEQFRANEEFFRANMGGRRKKRGGAAAQISGDTARRVGGAKKRAPSARGAIVRKVMAEQGLSLPQASKYVKDNGLY